MRFIVQAVKNYFSEPIACRQLDPSTSTYLQSAYPSNHTYRIQGQSIIPSRKLAARFSVMNELYPEPLLSLLDLSSCKGYFVFEAARRAACKRSLGIDICDKELAVCRTVGESMQTNAAMFEKLYLHQLVDEIDRFGGPFQTVLLINTYQYLFFGSDRDSFGYLDHEKIFGCIAKFCSDRVIFNNRTELYDCQNKEQIVNAGLAADSYSTEKIYEAASKYFTVSRVGKYGGYPLWVLHKL